METKPSRRDEPSSKKKHEKEKNKFEKLERRSLEKQTRKKHNKPKPQVIETEIEEEVFKKQLEKLKELAYQDDKDIRKIVKEIVETYQYE